MVVFDIFRKSKHALPRIEKSVFGPIEATLLNDDGSYYWETPNPLRTAKGDIGVFFDGTAAGPSQTQLTFWNWVYENVDALKKAAEPLIRERLRDFDLEQHFDDLVWSAAGLSADGSQQSPWDLSFTLPGPGRWRGAIFTACFKDGRPDAVRVDS